MSKNSKSSKMGKLYLVSSISIILIIVSWAIYHISMLLSLILVIVASFSYVICFLWLFQRRKDPRATAIIKVTVYTFIGMILLYISVLFSR